MRGLELVVTQASMAAALSECLVPVNAVPRYCREHAAADLDEAQANGTLANGGSLRCCGAAAGVFAACQPHNSSIARLQQVGSLANHSQIVRLVHLSATTRALPCGVQVTCHCFMGMWARGMIV